MKAGRGLLTLVATLAAGALYAPVAHAGSYDVLSCSIDGAFSRNGAWVAQNNPAGDARFAADATVSGDPSDVLLWLWGRLGDDAVTIEGDATRFRKRLAIVCE